MARHIGVRVGSIPGAPRAAAAADAVGLTDTVTPALTTGGTQQQRMGWTLTSANTGLAGVGIDRNTLPTYTGPPEVPAGTTISQRKITVPLDCFNGNITIDRCWIVPTSLGSPVGAFVSTIRDGTNPTTVGGVVVQDCEIDGDAFALNLALAQACAFAGIGTLRRNYIHGMGSGIAFINTGPTFSAVAEENYVTGLRAFGDPGTTGSHNEAATVRDLPRNSSDTRSAVFRGNRLHCQSGNDSGSLFLQPLWGELRNITVQDNYLEGGGYNLYLENHNFTYSNVHAVNNRFRWVDYGPVATSGGPGWTTWTGNYAYHATNPNNAGTAV